MITKRLNNVFLIGPMGAGKSTIGKQLASILKMEFFDTDREIEKRSGADIAWIYDIEGEEGFREREKKIVEELTQKNGIVLATGGGTVDSPENLTMLAGRGVVVYLMTTIEQQLARTAQDKRRPALQNNEDPRSTLEELMRKREASYREIADVCVATDGHSTRSLTQEILDQLQEYLS